jgi:hypothetical protein
MMNRNLILTVLEVGKSKIRAPSDPVSSDNAHSGSEMVMNSLSLHFVEGEKDLYEDSILIITSQRPFLQKISL